MRAFSPTTADLLMSSIDLQKAQQGSLAGLCPNGGGRRWRSKTTHFLCKYTSYVNEFCNRNGGFLAKVAARKDVEAEERLLDATGQNVKRWGEKEGRFSIVLHYSKE